MRQLAHFQIDHFPKSKIYSESREREREREKEDKLKFCLLPLSNIKFLTWNFELFCKFSISFLKLVYPNFILFYILSWTMHFPENRNSCICLRNYFYNRERNMENQVFQYQLTFEGNTGSNHIYSLKIFIVQIRTQLGICCICILKRGGIYGEI